MVKMLLVELKSSVDSSNYQNGQTRKGQALGSTCNKGTQKQSCQPRTESPTYSSASYILSSMPLASANGLAAIVDARSLLAA